MTTMSKKSAVADAVRGVSEPAFAFGNGRAVADAAERWIATSTECHREMIGFVSMRLEKDNETFREIIGCKNLADVTAVQSRWMEETLSDYSAEMSKLMAIYSRPANGRGRVGG